MRSWTASRTTRSQCDIVVLAVLEVARRPVMKYQSSGELNESLRKSLRKSFQNANSTTALLASSCIAATATANTWRSISPHKWEANAARELEPTMSIIQRQPRRLWLYPSGSTNCKRNHTVPRHAEVIQYLYGSFYVIKGLIWSQTLTLRHRSVAMQLSESNLAMI
jgi:hypothetical protein